MTAQVNAAPIANKSQPKKSAMASLFGSIMRVQSKYAPAHMQTPLIAKGNTCVATEDGFGDGFGEGDGDFALEFIEIVFPNEESQSRA